MKTNRIFSAIVAILLPAAMFGQALNTSYFIDNSFQRTRLNPAFQPASDAGFFNIALGGIGMDMNANFGTENFLFPKDGQLYTFMNKNVTEEEFLSGFNGDPNMNFNLNMDILGFGFRIGMLYVTAGVDLRELCNINMPIDMMRLAKSGMATSSEVFDISGLGINQTTFLECHIGAAVDLSGLIPGLSVGGRVKYALPAEVVQLNVTKGTIQMSNEKWMVETEAKAQAAVKGIAYDATNGFHLTSGYSGVGFCGSGLLFDLGAEYKLNLDLGALTGINASFSMTDIGSIAVTDRFVTTYKSAGRAEFAGLKGIDENTDIGQNLENVVDDFKTVANVAETPDKEAMKIGFKPNIFAGLEVALLQNHLSAGFLFSQQNGLDEFQISANAKFGIFNAAVSYAALNAKTLGVYAGITPRKHGISMFVGSDCIHTRFTPQYAPLGNMNATFRAGLAIVFETRSRVN